MIDVRRKTILRCSTGVLSRLTRPVRTLAWLVATVAATGQAQVDGDRRTTDPPPTLEAVLRRLDEAEARIRILEARPQGSVELGTTLLPATNETAGSAAISVCVEQSTTASTAVGAGSGLEPTHFDCLQALTESVATSRVKIGGVIHIDGTLFPASSPGIGFFENPSTGQDPDNRLEFRRLRPELSAELLDNMYCKLSIEFSNPNSPQVLDAYLGLRDVSFLQTVLIGNQVRPLGMEVYSSSKNSIFMEDALVFGASNVDARRLGVLSRGYTQDESVNWQFGIFEAANIQSTGQYLTDNFEGSIDVRVTTTPWYDESGLNYLHVGASTSFFNANNDAQLQSRPELRTESNWINTGAIAGSDWMNGSSLEAVLNLGSFSIGGEWVETFVNRTSDGPDVLFHGAYLYVAYFLTDDYQPMDRRLGTLEDVHPTRNFSPAGAGCGGWGAWQIAARISHFDLSDEDILGGRETNFTLGLNWWFNHFSRVMFNYVVGNIEDHAPVGGHTAGHFSGLAMRLQIDF